MIRKHKDNCCYNTCTGQEGTTKNLQGSGLKKKKIKKRRKKKKRKKTPPPLPPSDTGLGLNICLPWFATLIKSNIP